MLADRHTHCTYASPPLRADLSLPPLRTHPRSRSATSHVAPRAAQLIPVQTYYFVRDQLDGYPETSRTVDSLDPWCVGRWRCRGAVQRGLTAGRDREFALVFFSLICMAMLLQPSSLPLSLLCVDRAVRA